MIAVLAAALHLLPVLARPPSRVQPPVIGDPVAPFTLATTRGETFAWKPGRVTVICFCAFWCDTWKDQLPRVREAQMELKGLPVDFLTVSVDGRWSERGKKAAAGIDLSDLGNRWCAGIGIDRVPYTLLLDQKGVVRWASHGVLRSQELASGARNCLEGQSDGGSVYLTFDDFPAPAGNDELLDVLRAEGVSATFFCICSHLADHREQVERAKREGHKLEIHAWVHGEADTDLARCQAALRRFGGDGTLFRPHGSEYVLEVASRRRLTLPVDDPYDYQRPGAEELLRRISGQVRSGSIIQLHAGAKDTVDALPLIIARLRQRGFKFETLESMSSEGGTITPGRTGIH